MVRRIEDEHPEPGPMTEDERKMLQDIHAALLEVPAGSPKDVRPLLEEVRIVVRTHQRANWVMRSLIWLIPLMAGLGVAIEKIRGWI